MSHFYITENLKLAAALTACGFEIDLESSDRTIDEKGREKIVVALKTPCNGIKAEDLADVFFNRADSGVDEIIERRGLTREEVCALFFDGARTALQNRAQIIFCANNTKPLRAISIGGGRSLIYREGTSREELRKLINK